MTKSPIEKDRDGKRSGARVGVAALTTLLLLLLLPAAAQAVNVYAAASLREAFPKIVPDASYNFAGSGALQQQIEAGAPADVFASASPKEATALFQAGRCARPVTFATNVVVMLVPNSNPGNLQSVYDLRRGGLRLSIGVASVPIGNYTRKLLAKMQLSNVLQTNTVSQEANVAGITSKVALAEVDAGFAYVTDGKIVADRVQTIRTPKWAQPPVRYLMCAVTRAGADTAGADSFMKRVQAPAGRSILRQAGFGLPPDVNAQKKKLQRVKKACKKKKGKAKKRCIKKKLKKK